MSASPVPAAWTEPKPGKRAKSNGDAFVVRPDDEGAGWFIVLSDGASSSAFASSWARALVETVTSGWFTDSDFDELLDPVRKKFAPLGSRPDANFILEDKWNEEGSHATVVAAWVRPGASGADVSAVAVGDSVIGFESRRSTTMWPLSAATDFTSRPALVSSQPGSRSTIKRAKIQVPAGDVLFCATDGVGKWIAAHKNDEVPVVRRLMRTLAESPERGLRSTMVEIGGDEAVDALDDDLTFVCLDVPRPDAEREALLLRLARGVGHDLAWLRHGWSTRR